MILQKSIFLVDSRGPQSDLLRLQKLENLKNSSRDAAGPSPDNNGAYHKGLLYLDEDRTRVALSAATSTDSIFGGDQDPAS